MERCFPFVLVTLFLKEIWGHYFLIVTPGSPMLLSKEILECCRRTFQQETILNHKLSQYLWKKVKLEEHTGEWRERGPGWEGSVGGKESSCGVLQSKRWERRDTLGTWRTCGTWIYRSGKRLAPEKEARVSKEEVKWGHTRRAPQLCQPCPSGKGLPQRLTAPSSKAILSYLCWLKLPAPSLRPQVRCASHCTVSSWNLLGSYMGTLQTSHSKMNSSVLTPGTILGKSLSPLHTQTRSHTSLISKDPGDLSGKHNL